MRLKYIGGAGRYYPTLGITPVPGDSYELDHDPDDGNWAVTQETISAAPAAPTSEVKSA